MRDEPRRMIPPAAVTTDQLTDMLVRGESGAVIRQLANPYYAASTAVVGELVSAHLTTVNSGNWASTGENR